MTMPRKTLSLNQKPKSGKTHDAIVVRNPKSKTADSPAGKSTARPKRKRTVPTKRELQRRVAFEKRRAKEIMREQDRATLTPACSKNSIRRMIKAALEKVAAERQIEGEPLALPHIAKNAVKILHEIIEDHAVTRFNKASFVLETANRTTLNLKSLECLDFIAMAERRQPVFELPVAEPSATRPAPVNGEEAGEEEEEEAAFTDSETEDNVESS